MLRTHTRRITNNEDIFFSSIRKRYKMLKPFTQWDLYCDADGGTWRKTWLSAEDKWQKGWCWLADVILKHSTCNVIILIWCYPQSWTSTVTCDGRARWPEFLPTLIWGLNKARWTVGPACIIMHASKSLKWMGSRPCVKTVILTTNTCTQAFIQISAFIFIVCIMTLPYKLWN